jgi:outer membrane protein assembly factor BamB
MNQSILVQEKNVMNQLQRKTVFQTTKTIFVLSVFLLLVSYGLSLHVPAALKKAAIVPLAQSPSEVVLYRGNAQRTGEYSEPAIRQMSAVKWTKTIGSVVNESPVFANGVLYLGSDLGRIMAIDAATGQTLWSAKGKNSTVFSPVAVADNAVYVGAERKFFYAFNAQTGEILWKFKIKATVWTAPLVVNRTIYFASDDGNLYALTTAGEQKWKINAGHRSIAAPVFDKGVVFFVAENLLLALDGETGQEKWRIETGANDWWNAPAIANDTILVGNGDRACYAINSQTGAVLWKYEASGDNWSAPAIANGIAYIGNKNETLYALNVQNGELLWSFKAEDAATSAPILANGTLYFGVGNHEFPPREGPRHLYALDAQSGQELWRFQAESRLLAGPAIGGGAIYFATFSGKLYAIR